MIMVSSSVHSLLATEEELSSYRALKVVAASVYTSTPLQLTACNDVTKLTPICATFVLQQAQQEVLLGGSANTILRALATFAPAKCLLGSSLVEAAQVDGWTSYLWNSLEVPLQAISGVETTAAEMLQADIESALFKLNAHLLYKTYLVGKTITIADISLLCVLIGAAYTEDKLKEDYPHLSRWYDTLLHQPFVSVARQVQISPSKFYNPLHGDGAVALNGAAPPVVPKLYKRHRIRMKELFAAHHAYVHTVVTVAGWVRTVRNANKGQLLFIELNDGSTPTSLQCLLEVPTIPNFDECKACGGAGASFQITGTVVPSAGKQQAIEILAISAVLLGPVYGGVDDTIGGMHYPLSKKTHTLEYMRENAHLRARTKLHSAAMRIRHAMAYATHKFFHDHGFLYIHTPIITGADCEGAGEQFAVTTMLTSDPHTVGVTLPVHKAPEVVAVEDGATSSSKKKKNKPKKTATTTAEEDVKIPGAVDYSSDFFSKRANLTVSGQLNVETHCCALSDVYTFGPTFRAENSHTSRHLAEFWMIEPEIAFATLEDDMNLAEDYLKYCVQYALENCAEDLEFFDEVCPFGEKGLRKRLQCVLAEPFKRLDYTEGIEILQKAVQDGVKFQEKPVWGMDLPSEFERYLCEKVFEKPVILMNYPKDIKAFYMKLNDDGKTVAAADILVPKIGEIIGGSQREHRRDVLMQRCTEMGLDPKAVWWYLDLRKYGTIPHAGFGLGFERLMLFVTGLDNIRDVIPFPRWPGNADF